MERNGCAIPSDPDGRNGETVPLRATPLAGAGLDCPVRSDYELIMPDTWIAACNAADIALDDVIRFDHEARTFAIYRTADDRYYATDGLCTHAKVHLAGGFMMDTIIECPKHNGRFDFTTGEAKGAPACINLKTYPVKLEAGQVLINLG